MIRHANENNTINKRTYVEERETVKFVTNCTKYKATMTRNDYEKNMYYSLLLIITQ